MSLPCNEIVSQKASLEIHIDLGETTFKLIRDKYCTSNTVTPAFQPKSATISSHVVFVYSTLVAFIIALSVTVFVTMMQKVNTYLIIIIVLNNFITSVLYRKPELPCKKVCQ